MAKRKSRASYRIQTVVNAIQVLDAFREADEYGVTELATKLGLHKNNVFRLLATLQELGYVEQTPSDRYQLSARALELGQAFLRGRPLVRRARPFLEELAALSHESAHLATLQDSGLGYDAVFLDGVVGDQLVQTASRLGRHLPAHSTAAGKVLLGCAPQALREHLDRKVSRNGGLAARTPHTIVDIHKLLEHLRTVGIERYALDLEECEEGLVCAAAPVVGPNGEPVAALSVSGPIFRLVPERLRQEVVPLVTDAAERLSRDLGAKI